MAVMISRSVCAFSALNILVVVLTVVAMAGLGNASNAGLHTIDSPKSSSPRYSRGLLQSTGSTSSTGSGSGTCVQGNGSCTTTLSCCGSLYCYDSTGVLAVSSGQRGTCSLTLRAPQFSNPSSCTAQVGSKCIKDSDCCGLKSTFCLDPRTGAKPASSTQGICALEYPSLPETGCLSASTTCTQSYDCCGLLECEPKSGSRVCS